MNNVTELFDKKLIVLFILKESKQPLTVDQISRLCLEFEDITYIDICIFIQSLKQNNYITEVIQDEKIYYLLTDSGFDMLTELIELVPGMNLLNIKNILKEQIEGYKQEYEIDTITIPIKVDEYKVSCFIKDGNDELINITIYAGDKENAKKISKHWKDNATEMYGKIIELMTK